MTQEKVIATDVRICVVVAKFIREHWGKSIIKNMVKDKTT